MNFSESLFSKYKLKPPIAPPIKLIDGLIHDMELIENENGKFAVKKLNAEIMTRPGLADAMNQCESIAERFNSLGINAVYALKTNGQYVTELEGKFYLVYPYIAGTVMTAADRVTPDIAQKIGSVLGRIHQTNLQVDFQPETTNDTLAYTSWIEIATQIKLGEFEWSKKCLSFIEQMASWYDQVHFTSKNLENDLVISHKDMDMKNVIWKDGEPFIIDWESAGYVNPDLDLIRVALDWSGESSGKVDEAIFKQILITYSSFRTINSKKLEQSLYICRNDLLAWLEFNIKRAVGLIKSDESKVLISHGEIPKAIDIINSRLENISQYTKWAIEVSNK